MKDVLTGFVLALGWPAAALAFVMWSNVRVDLNLRNHDRASTVFRTCDKFEVIERFDGHVTVIVQPREKK